MGKINNQQVSNEKFLITINFYPGTCRDNYMAVFILTKEELEDGEDVAMCPECSLIMKVIDDYDQFTYGEAFAAPTVNK